jgi:hypothetical protein
MVEHLKKHSFRQMKTIISKSTNLKIIGKDRFCINKEEWKPAICLYIEKISSFSSCYNKKKRYFIKCCCLKRLANFDCAVEYLAHVGVMSKCDNDYFYKELINGWKQSSTEWGVTIKRATLSLCYACHS